MTFIPRLLFNSEELKNSCLVEDTLEVRKRADMFEKECRKILKDLQLRYNKLEASFDAKTSGIVDAYHVGNMEECTNLINSMLKDFCIKYDRDLIQIKGIS